jgi:membrane fusion protein, multidrug efflux system
MLLKFLNDLKAAPFALSILVMSQALASCDHKDAVMQPTAVTEERLTITVHMVDDVKPLAATLTTRQTGEATARISGILTSLKVREGDVVTQGQIIGYVQDQKINLQTGAFDQAAIAAQAQADLAHAALKRTQVLFDKGFYAQARLDQDKAASDAADANAKAARAQSAASGEASRQGAIIAPGAGRVIRAKVPVGSVVMMGQSVATITAGNRVVRIELPEGQAQALHMGQTLVLDASGTRATGTIAEIYPSIAAGQVVADVTATGFENLAIGQKVVALLSVGQRNAVVIPKRFIATRYGLDYVKLIQKGVAMETIVQTTPTGDPQQIEILGGATPGDQILSYGVAQ